MNPAAAMQPDSQTTAAQVLDASANSQAPTPGAPPAGASKSAPAQDDKIAPKLQLLIQREKTALERERAAKAKEAEIEAKATSFAEREAKLAEFESLKTKNPLKALELLGLSYQDLTNIALADGNVTPDVAVRRVEEKVDSFVKTQAEALQRQEEEERRSEEKRHAKTIETFQGEITKYLKENSTRYELIEFEQSESLVYGVIDEHYNRTLAAATAKAEESGEDTSELRGEVLTIAQAADKVEQHLEQKYDKARNLNKVKSLLAPRQAAPTVEKQKNPTRQMPQTLNNQLSATPATQRKAPISDDERIAKAIAYARGLRP